MTGLTLDTARKILDAALSKATQLKTKPMAIVVLDARGAIRASISQDGTSLMRHEVAHGKAYGAVALGMGSRSIFKRANEQPYFVDAVNTMARGALIPVPGGVLIKDASGEIVGAVGISGDTSDNDETCCVTGIEAAGLKADGG